MYHLKLLYVILATLSVSVTATHRPAIPVKVFAEDLSVYPRNISYRLPNETYPETYKIDLTWVDEDQFSFEGIVTIGVIIRTNTNTIVVHKRHIEINKVTIQLQGQGSPNPIIEPEFEYANQTDFLTITNEAMTAGSKYTLKISYSGQLRTDNIGFFRQSYVAESGERRQSLPK